MPTDPLTYAAEQLAPARATTNFFDPAPGQNVISRYANSGIALSGATDALDFQTKQAAAQREMARAQRDALLADREDVEYAERQDFKAQRGEFLDQLATIDPTADDFDEQSSALLSSLPAGALEDDAVKALLSHKSRIADSIRTEREMEARRQDQLRISGLREDQKSDNWREREGIRQQNKTDYQSTVERLKNARAGLDPNRAAELADDPELAAYESAIAQRQAKSTDAKERMDYAAQLSGSKDERRDRMSAAINGLKPEEINQFRTDDGQIDWESLAFATGERKRGIAEDTAVRRETRAEDTAIRRETRAEDTTIRREGRKLKAEAARSPTEKTLFKVAADSIYDQGAFPSALDNLRKQFPKDGLADLKARPEYVQAAEWDKDRQKYEMNAALNQPSAEAFVKLVPGLNEAQKRKRANFWEAVNGLADDTPAGAPRVRRYNPATGKIE